MLENFEIKFVRKGCINNNNNYYWHSGHRGTNFHRAQGFHRRTVVRGPAPRNRNDAKRARCSPKTAPASGVATAGRRCGPIRWRLTDRPPGRRLKFRRWCRSSSARRSGCRSSPSSCRATYASAPGTGRCRPSRSVSDSRPPPG